MASAADVAAKLRQLGAGGFRRVVEVALVETALRAQSVAQDRARTILNVRSGNLERSIVGFVRQGENGPEAVVRAGGRVPGRRKEVVYAGTHEYGATIVAKPGRFLRIPLPPALTGNGANVSDRFGGPLRTMAPGLFRVFESPRTGKLYLKHLPSGQLWYRLVKSVTIRPRPFLRPGAEDAAEHFPRYLAAALERATQ